MTIHDKILKHLHRVEMRANYLSRGMVNELEDLLDTIVAELIKSDVV